MAEVLVRQLFRETEKYADSEVTVRGWIRTNRGSNKFGFVELFVRTNYYHDPEDDALIFQLELM